MCKTTQSGTVISKTNWYSSNTPKVGETGSMVSMFTRLFVVCLPFLYLSVHVVHHLLTMSFTLLTGLLG